MKGCVARSAPSRAPRPRRPRALQGEEGAVLHPFHARASGQFLADQGEVGVLARGVDDQIEPVRPEAAAGRVTIRVVQYAALVRSAAGNTAADRVPGSFTSAGTSVSKASAGSAPSSAISQAWPMWETSNRPGRRAGMLVFLQDAHGELNRHVVAGEADHLAAQGAVQRGQRRCLQVLVRHAIPPTPSVHDTKKRAVDFRRRAPLSSNLRE
jgi:hypothetical protein